MNISDITAPELNALNALYLDRLQTSFLYNYASVMVRSYSEDLSQRLSVFARQDTNHAVCLHGLLVDTSGLGLFTSPSTFPIIIEGVKANGDKGPDPGEEAATFLETFRNIEADILARLEALSPKSPLMEASRDYLDFSWLRDVIAERITALSNLRNVVASGTIWKSEAKTSWGCLTCGLVVAGNEAPEECPCCHAERKALAQVLTETWRQD